MPQIISKEIGLFLFICSFITGCTTPDPFIRGTLDAQRHLADGKFVVKVKSGRYASSPAEYRKTLKSKYGIEQEISLDEPELYVDGYNKTMLAAITKKYGGQVFDEAHKASKSSGE